MAAGEFLAILSSQLLQGLEQLIGWVDNQAVHAEPVSTLAFMRSWPR
jgi:hypothetical protein